MFGEGGQEGTVPRCVFGKRVARNLPNVRLPTKQELAALKAEAAATTAKDAKTISELTARIFVLEAELVLLNEHAENEAFKVAARATKTEQQHWQRTSAGKSKAYSAGAKSTVAKLNQAVTAAAKAATKAATKAAQQRFEDELDRAVGTGEFQGMFAKIGTLFEETTAASHATTRAATSAAVASEAGVSLL